MSHNRPVPKRTGRDFVLADIPILDSPQSIRADSLRQKAPAKDAKAGDYDMLEDDDRCFGSLADPDPLMLPARRSATHRTDTEARHTHTGSNPHKACVPVPVATSPHAVNMARRITDRQAEIRRTPRGAASTSRPAKTGGTQVSKTAPPGPGRSSPRGSGEGGGGAVTTASSTARQPVFSSTQQQPPSALRHRVKPYMLPAAAKVSRVPSKPQLQRTSFSISCNDEEEAQRRVVHSAMEQQNTGSRLRQTSLCQRQRLEQVASSQRSSARERPREEPSTPSITMESSSASSVNVTARARLQRSAHGGSSDENSLGVSRDRRERSQASSLSSQLSGPASMQHSATLAVPSLFGTLPTGGPAHSAPSRSERGAGVEADTHLSAQVALSRGRQPAVPQPPSSVAPPPAPVASHPRGPSIVAVQRQRKDGAGGLPDKRVPSALGMLPLLAARRGWSGIGDASSAATHQSSSYDSTAALFDGLLIPQDSPLAGSARMRSSVAERGGASQSLRVSTGERNVQSRADSRVSSDDVFSDTRFMYRINSDSTATSGQAPQVAPRPTLPLSPSPTTSELTTSSGSLARLYQIPSLSQSLSHDPTSHAGVSAALLSRHSTGSNPQHQATVHLAAFAVGAEGGERLNSAAATAAAPTTTTKTTTLSPRTRRGERTGGATTTAAHDLAPCRPHWDVERGTACLAERSKSVESFGGDPPFVLGQWGAVSADDIERDRERDRAPPPSVLVKVGGVRRETWSGVTRTGGPAQERASARAEEDELVPLNRPHAQSVTLCPTATPHPTTRFFASKDRHVSLPSSSTAGITSSSLGDSRLHTDPPQQRLSTSTRVTGFNFPVSSEAGAGTSSAPPHPPQGPKTH